MVDTIEPAEAGEDGSKKSSRAVRTTKPDLLSIAGLASLAAGAIHATAVGAHSEHKQAVWAFIGVATFQLVWGGLALLRPNRLLALVGIVGNGAAVVGWAWAKADGISFIDGLDNKEPIQFADGLAAGLAAAAVLFALAPLLGRPLLARQPRAPLFGMAALLAVALVVPGMYKTGSHDHAAGHSHDGTESADGHDHAAALPVKAYDPTLPIDLSGVDGVTPEQQARAENLIAITLIRLPQFADPAVAYAAGYRSIGDAATGVEHFIKWDLINDDKVLNPDYPESLVYEVDEEHQTFMYSIAEPPPAGTRKLVSAMFMLTEHDSLDDTPDVGGKLTQWHIHNNLCFDKDPRIEAPLDSGPRVVGVTDGQGKCRPGTFSLPPAPMIHVWITPHPCGPFAALEGVGAGQTKDGEEKNCDHVHGSA
jgi:hypothetical protein